MIHADALACALLGDELGDGGDMWAGLAAFPAALDASLVPQSSETAFSPSLSSMSSPVDDALMLDHVNMDVSSPGPDVRSQLFDQSATSDSADSNARYVDVGQVTLQDVGGLSSGVAPVENKLPLASLWEQEDAIRRSKVASAKEEAPASPLMWANPVDALMKVDAPNANTMEMRRLKNREGMRRARQRQREDYNRLKASVTQLEEQYAQLCMREAPALEDVISMTDSSSETTGGTMKDKQQRRYLLALALTKRLRAENMYLKAGLQQHATWKQHLHRILDSTAEPSSDLHGIFQPSVGSSRSSPAASPRVHTAGTSLSRPIALNFDVMDAHEAETLFNFSPLDAAAVSRVVVDNAYQAQQIRSSLMAAVDAKDPRVRLCDMLGWSVIQRVRGKYFENVFTKTFTDLDIGQAGQNMWMNDMQMDTFRVILYNLHRLDVLQRVDTNAYILGRDVKAPDGNTVFRSVFIRFRTQVTREIPNGSSPPLQATGFVIGSHSTTRDWSSSTSLPEYQSYYPGDGGNRPAGLRDGEALEWADFVYTTEFLTIKDPSTGETHHQIQWTGRSDFKSQAEALRSAPDALTVCLRTEMLMFRPAFQLRAISGGKA